MCGVFGLQPLQPSNGGDHSGGGLVGVSGVVKEGAMGSGSGPAGSPKKSVVKKPAGGVEKKKKALKRL